MKTPAQMMVDDLVVFLDIQKNYDQDWILYVVASALHERPDHLLVQFMATIIIELPGYIDGPGANANVIAILELVEGMLAVRSMAVEIGEIST